MLLETTQPPVRPAGINFDTLTLPVYCRFGAHYYRIENPHKSLQVKNYVRQYGITYQEQYGTEAAINGIEDGSHQIIAAGEFALAFDVVAERMGLRKL